jgi:hypothetical protein
MVIATFGVVLTAIVAYLKNLNTEINSIKVAMSRLDTQVSPLWAKVQAQISADLHHPDERYHEMDKLLERLENLTISPSDRERLKVLLLQRATDPDVDQSQRDKASIMAKVMDMVVAEQGKFDDNKQPH